MELSESKTNKAKEVQSQIQNWRNDCLKRVPDVEKMSAAKYDELLAYESCLELVEKAFGLKTTDRVTV